MKPERTKEEIIADVLGWESFSSGPVMADTDDFMKAMEEYRQSSTVEKWVSVKERLPDKGVPVLVWLGIDEGAKTDKWDGRDWEKHNWDHVTHWLPELPPIEEPKEK